MAKGSGQRAIKSNSTSRYEMISHRFHTGRLHELERAAIQAFEVRRAYKSPWGIHLAAYASEIQMELFIISTLGMHLNVVI